jgi:hypothetical protein
VNCILKVREPVETAICNKSLEVKDSLEGKIRILKYQWNFSIRLHGFLHPLHLTYYRQHARKESKLDPRFQLSWKPIMNSVKKPSTNVNTIQRRTLPTCVAKIHSLSALRWILLLLQVYNYAEYTTTDFVLGECTPDTKSEARI